MSRRSTTSRCATTCGGRSPTARRSSTCPCGSTSTRTRSRRPTTLVADVAAAVAEAARGLNRYPDRDAVALRADLAAYLGREPASRSPLTSSGRPTAPTRSCSSCCRPSAGRVARALGFAPTYSMYPEYCRDTFTGYVTAPRDGRLQRRRRPSRWRPIAEHRPDIVLLASPNNPTGTALALDTVARGAVRGAGDGRRRRGVRRVPATRARRARSRCSPTTPAWSSPAR